MKEIYNVIVFNREGAEHHRLVFSEEQVANNAIDKLLEIGVDNWKIRAFKSILNPEIEPDDYKYI